MFRYAKDQFAVAAKSGSGNTRGTPDTSTAKLAALHYYQLSIPAPKPPQGSYDKAAFEPRARRSSATIPSGARPSGVTRSRCHRAIAGEKNAALTHRKVISCNT